MRPMIGSQQGKILFVTSNKPCSRLQVRLLPNSLLLVILLLLFFTIVYSIQLFTGWSDLLLTLEFTIRNQQEEGSAGENLFSFLDFDVNQESNSLEGSFATTTTSPPPRHDRPILYTYVEYNDNNNESMIFNDMSRADHEALIELWKESWTAAGWNPQVLTIHHAQRHVQYPEWDKLLKLLDNDNNNNEGFNFNRMVFHRWMAMSATLQQQQQGDGGGDGVGGWMSDYDVFPLDIAFSHHHNSNQQQPEQYLNTENLPPLLPDDTITLYEKVAPSFVAGTALAWQVTTQALMDQIRDILIQEQEQSNDNNNTNNNDNHKRRGRRRLVYWTDTLGLLELWRQQKVRVESRVVSLERAAAATLAVMHVHDCNQTVQSSSSSFTLPLPYPRAIRNKWAVHVSARSLITLVAPPPPPSFGKKDDETTSVASSSSSFSKLRLPRNRATVARQWLEFIGLGGVIRTTTHHYSLCSSENQ